MEARQEVDAEQWVVHWTSYAGRVKAGDDDGCIGSSLYSLPSQADFSPQGSACGSAKGRTASIRDQALDADNAGLGYLNVSKQDDHTVLQREPAARQKRPSHQAASDTAKV
ncbi:uncharacterized protein AB675_3940 [Cyphellophora attinorum]|uniref:Uncharacterized protein n=1 Tax=Cyphellophora attinorum TaxID=1664694 RepID=A0A0N1HQ61_9EURO|nr:uncharacterized protein AB675_3940 [Phialophora attinorum]KPI37545.1 hypothetical protein AB675_3940 [Phialophora attinorum]